MAYTVANVRDLRSTLQEKLADELGLYSNGVVSLWVEPPSVPAELSCDGLQCVIGRYATPISGSIHRWTVTLTQFDRSDAGMVKLDRAIAKIRYKFPRSRIVVPPIKEDEYPMAVFSIFFYVAALPGDLAEVLV